VLAALLFFYWKYLSGGKKFAVVTGQGYSNLRVTLGKWRYLALGGCLIYVAVMIVMPLLFLVICLFMSRFGFFHNASPFSLFLSTPLRTVLYGTVWGIALALILADSPVTTQAFKAGFLQLGSDLEEAARVSGASWRATYRRILLPLLAPIAAAVGLMNFGNALTSISAPVLLYSHQSRPLAILLLEYSFTGELERGAALGLLVTLIIGAMMIVGRKLGLQLSGSD